MNIIGPDSLIFGVDDVDACVAYLTDYGLAPRDVTPAGGRFRSAGRHFGPDPSHGRPEPAAAMGTASTLRKTVYGVADAATLAAIAAGIEQGPRGAYARRRLVGSVR